MVLVPTLRHKLFENPIFYLKMADKVWNPILKVYVLVKNIYCNYIIIRYSFFTINLFKKVNFSKVLIQGVNTDEKNYNSS